MIPKGYFKKNYGPLRGRDWLADLPPWERQALAHIANALSDYGKQGGKARARTAQRDRRGRFAPNN